MVIGAPICIALLFLVVQWQTWAYFGDVISRILLIQAEVPLSTDWDEGRSTRLGQHHGSGISRISVAVA